MSIGNPAHPLHPLNPLNPFSPNYVGDLRPIDGFTFAVIVAIALVVAALFFAWVYR